MHSAFILMSTYVDLLLQNFLQRSYVFSTKLKVAGSFCDLFECKCTGSLRILSHSPLFVSKGQMHPVLCQGSCFQNGVFTYHARWAEYVWALSTVGKFYFTLVFTTIKNFYTVYMKVLTAAEGTFWVVNVWSVLPWRRITMASKTGNWTFISSVFHSYSSASL